MKSKFPKSQIVGLLGEGEVGLAVAEICRKHGISNAAYYQWKSEYSVCSSQRAQTHQRPRSRKLQAQAHVCRVGARECCHQRCFIPKVLTPTARRAVIDSMVSDHQLSLSKACKLAGLSRSVFYKPKTDWAAKDAPVVDALNAIVAVRARWVFWKCFTRMRKDGLPWNHKRVYRVYCNMRLNMKRRTNKRVITRERQPQGG